MLPTNDIRLAVRGLRRSPLFASVAILSLGLGFALTTNWLLDAVRHPFLHGVGITLLIIGIPILILGGHCLDLMDKKNKRPDQVLHLSRGSLRE